MTSVTIRALLAAAILLGGAETVRAQTEPPISPRDFIGVTDDDADPHADGCDAITIANSADGSIVAHSNQRFSPGRLAVTSDATMVATQWQNGWPPFIQIMLWRPALRRWMTAEFTDNRLAQAGVIAISPDNQFMIVSWRDEIAMYRVDDIDLRRLGPVVGTASFDVPGGSRSGTSVAAAIEFTADSGTAYVVASDGYVHVLDTARADWRRSPITYTVAARQVAYRVPSTHASLSPDEKWLAVNTANLHDGRINLINVESGYSVLVDAPGLRESWGVAFNHVGPGRGLLAVHGSHEVVVYRLSDTTLVRQAIATIPQQSKPDMPAFAAKWWRRGAIAWSGDGSRVIAGIGGRREWRILDYEVGPPAQLTKQVDFDSCKAGRTAHLGTDVVTIQDRSPPPSQTPTNTAVPTPSPTATVTLGPTDTVTASPSPTATHTAVPTQTDVPAPLYLPLLLTEHCSPEHHRSDIALVIDTSSSMSGQKLADAREAALLFVDMIDLAPGRSQVAVVRYDREAELVRELTRSRTLIEAAVCILHIRSGTHIDKGLRAALAELQSERHLERNAQVIVLLTDGIQTGTPGEELRAAAEVHSADVRLYAIGLGDDVDEATLRSMAGTDDRYYFAPDSGDLARIYGEIAKDLMCPGVDLWGGR